MREFALWTHLPQFKAHGIQQTIGQSDCDLIRRCISVQTQVASYNIIENCRKLQLSKIKILKAFFLNRNNSGNNTEN